MKKIFTLLMTLVLVFSVSNVAFADQGKLTVSGTQSAHRGEKVELTVSLENCANANTLGIEISYDKNVLTDDLNAYVWVQEGKLQDYDPVKGQGAWAIEETKSLNGEVFKLAFEVNGNALFGKTDVDVKLIVKNDNIVVGTYTTTVSAEVVCEHAYEYTNVDANNHVKVCKNCKDEVVEAHKWDEGKVTEEVTELTPGTKVYTCTECKATKTETIPAPGHDMVKVEAKDATCTEAGNKEYFTCNTCGKAYADAEGKTETTVEANVIPALGHDMVKTEAKEATCTEAGTKGYYTCENCDKVYADAEGKTETTVEANVIPAPGHNYVSGICTVCDHKVKVEDTIVEADKVEDVDTTKPVEVVTPVVKQEAVDSTIKEVSKVVENILSDNISEETKEAVSEETMKEIKKEIELGNSITTEIYANQIDESKVETAVIESIKTILEEKQKVAQYLDLSVMIQSVSENGAKKDLGTLNVLEEKISFVVVIPAELEKEGREFFVIRVHDGVAEKLDVTKNADGSYSFETDRFSTYALAYEDAEELPKTGDTTPIVLWIALLGLGSMMLVASIYRIKRIK